VKDEEQYSFKNVEARNTFDYMLRTSQQAHLQLSMMADQKASILLGAEVVMLTLLFGQLGPEQVDIWVFVLAGFVFLSAIFALMTVMPKYKVDLEGISNPNWLFFAFAAQLSPQEYRKKIAHIAQADARIYETIVNDIHQMGSVLYKKKFRFLNLSYKTLLMGIAATFAMVLARQIGL